MIMVNLYVIGDIHCRSDLLDQITHEISRNLAINPVSAKRSRLRVPRTMPGNGRGGDTDGAVAKSAQPKTRYVLGRIGSFWLRLL